jgi:hypothetical protein
MEPASSQLNNPISMLYNVISFLQTKHSSDAFRIINGDFPMCSSFIPNVVTKASIQATCPRAAGETLEQNRGG